MMDAATLKLVQARGCAAAIVDHAIEARRGSTIACNNDGAPGLVNGSAGFGPGPYGNLTYLEQHRIVSPAFNPGLAHLLVHLFSLAHGSTGSSLVKLFEITKLMRALRS